MVSANKSNCFDIVSQLKCNCIKVDLQLLNNWRHISAWVAGNLFQWFLVNDYEDAMKDYLEYFSAEFLHELNFNENISAQRAFPFPIMQPFLGAAQFCSIVVVSFYTAHVIWSGTSGLRIRVRTSCSCGWVAWRCDLSQAIADAFAGDACNTETEVLMTNYLRWRKVLSAVWRHFRSISEHLWSSIPESGAGAKPTWETTSHAAPPDDAVSLLHLMTESFSGIVIRLTSY